MNEVTLSIAVLSWISGLFVGLALLGEERRVYGEVDPVPMFFTVAAILFAGAAVIVGVTNA